MKFSHGDYPLNLQAGIFIHELSIAQGERESNKRSNQTIQCLKGSGMPKGPKVSSSF